MKISIYVSDEMHAAMHELMEKDQRFRPSTLFQSALVEACIAAGVYVEEPSRSIVTRLNSMEQRIDELYNALVQKATK